MKAFSQILALLKKTYPDAHCELNYSNPLELLIATILSAQCTDVRVNMATPVLFKRYPDVQSLADANLGDVEELLKSINFFRNKAKNLIACCRQLIEKHQGEVPRSIDELSALAGVGRKTANVVLGNAFNINYGVVVDTHVKRLSDRLGLTKNTDPVKVEQDLMKIVPQEDWTLFSHLLIWHGRRRCMARNPDCAHCELSKVCPSYPIE